VSAAARKFGKRPVFLFSALMGLIGCIIGETANTYHHLLTARVIQGFSSSAFESILVSSIGDLYFVHERGLRVSIFNFAVGAVSSLSFPALYF
jgi:MFS family permease